MKRPGNLFLGAALMLGYAAFLTWIFCMSGIRNTYLVMEVRPLWIVGCLLLTYAIDAALVRRGVSVSLLLGLQLLFAGGGIVVLMHAITLYPGGLGTRILLGVFYAGGVGFAAYTADEGVRHRTLLFFFHALAGSVAILLLLERYLHLPAIRPTLLSCLVAAVVVLFAMASERFRLHGGGVAAAKGGRAVWAGMIAAILILTASLTALTAAFLLNGLNSITAVFLSALQQCLTAARSAAVLLTRFMEWMLGLLSPLDDGTPVEELEIPGLGGGNVLPGGKRSRLPVSVGYIAGALLMLGIGFLLFRLRRRRIPAKVMDKRAKIGVSRRNGFFQTLRALCLKWELEAEYRLNRFRCRRTPAGLLAWCERQVPRRQRRRKGESGPQFLRRLSGSRGEAAAITELARLVELSFYSSGQPPVVPDELYTQVRQTMKTLRSYGKAVI